MAKLIFLKTALVWFGIFLACRIGFAQSQIGQTEVITFDRNQYSAGAQNWALERDKNNRLYIANNEGLLVYNGKNWQVFPAPNKTILRSIGFGPGGKLFAGAQDEFGYFAPDEVGRLRFTSLKPLLPAPERKFPDVWQLEVSRNEVFFRTNQTIFRYAGQKVDVHHSQTSWISLHQHQGKVLAQQADLGLFVWENRAWKQFIQPEDLPEDFLITDLIDYQKDTSLLCTEKNGLFFLVGSKLIPFRVYGKEFNPVQHLTTLSLHEDNSFLVGTYYNGLYHIASSGAVLENVSGINGLRNNTIRCLLSDNSGKIWMGLDNGIAYFEYQNAIRHINPPSFKNGVGYDVLSFDNQLYFALSTGLQCLPITQKEDLGNIADVPKLLLSGLTWKVAAIKGQIVTGRDDGFWHIKNQKANPVSRKSGYWNFKPMPTSDSLQIVAGSYLGVRLLKLENGEFKDQGKIPGFSESSRYLETDNGHIWVSHPYRGVYKIYASDGSLVLFRQKDGLPSDLDNHVFKIKEKILLATSRGIYEFDSVQNRMVKSSFFEPIFGELPIRYLKEDNKGNIWFVQEKMVGVIDFSSGKPRMHYLPELKNKIASGFENIFPYDSKNIFVGSDEGFFHINYEKYQTKIKPFSVYLTQVKTISAEDSTLYGGFQFQEVAKSQNPAYPYGFNSLHFAFAASVFDHSSSLEFSHFLEGFDKTWSSWTPKSEKDYTNLPEGTYHFHMKARKSPSHESSVFTYSFTIDPPIYRTFAAYILYIISVAGFLFALLKFQSRRYRKRQEARRQADQKKFREEQEQMAYRHQLEMEKSEKEFIRLQNDKLESEIEHKNTELASATMNLVQKKEFILKLKTELQHYQEINKVGGENPELKKLLKTLSEEEKLNKEWEHFSQHFNSMYGDFLTVLKSKFPTLKPHELQLCAYLRMNLSSKEIAPLMSISVRGVEIGRYRLRKKLNLSTEENLVQYLLDLKMN